MLRAIPDKQGGVLVLLASIVVLMFLPIFSRVSGRNDFAFADFRATEVHVYMFVFICVVLAYIGSQEAVQPFIAASQFLALLYFAVLIFRLGAVQVSPFKPNNSRLVALL